MNKLRALHRKYRVKRMQHLSVVVVAHALKWRPMRQPLLRMSRTKN
jgi:hypothetical protein